jgi:hypothetical protein
MMPKGTARPRHGRQVDHQAIIDAAEARAVVAAAADCDGELVLAAEIDRVDDIPDIGTAGNHQRMLVDHAVVEPARRFIIGVAASEHRTALARCKAVDGFRIHGLFLLRRVAAGRGC